MAYDVNRVKVDEVFKVCPNCGYEDGFHSMFERSEDSGDFSWKLICPSCHKIFDIGLRVHVDS